MVMDYIQEFEWCHGVIRVKPEEPHTIFIRASAVEIAEPYHEGFVRLYIRGESHDIVADIKEVVEWMNCYAPNVDV